MRVTAQDRALKPALKKEERFWRQKVLGKAWPSRLPSAHLPGKAGARSFFKSDRCSAVCHGPRQAERAHQHEQHRSTGQPPVPWSPSRQALLLPLSSTTWRRALPPSSSLSPCYSSCSSTRPSRTGCPTWVLEAAKVEGNSCCSEAISIKKNNRAGAAAPGWQVRGPRFTLQK